MPGPGNVGERVRDLRLSRRLSQAQLAGHDLSDSYISLIESGKRTPTPSVVRLLSERLGCTAEYLAEGIEPEQRAHVEVRARHAELALLAGAAETALAGFNEVVIADDNPDLTLRARWGRARALELLGRTGEAITAFEELRELAERDSGRTSWIPSVIALSRCYHTVGDLGQSLALGERALSRLAELGLRTGEDRAEVVRVLLLAWLDRSESAKARELSREIISPAEAGAEDADSLYAASLQALQEGALGDAAYLADQAIAAHGSGVRATTQARLQVAGARTLLRGDEADGLRALDLLAQAGPHLTGFEAACCAIETARALIGLGRLDEAVETVHRTLSVLGGELDESAAGPTVAQAKLVLAQAKLAQGERDAALAVLRATAAQIETFPTGRHTASLSRELGDLFESAGDGTQATIAYRRALESVGLRAARQPEQALAESI
jgi:transcriptional regulator with XRE-family HTH domain/predicted negative regulator of RcsB-dependent stress response